MVADNLQKFQYEDKQKQQYLDERHRAYHETQFSQPKRSTIALAVFLREHAPEGVGSVLDVGCGGGANMYHLRDCFPKARWVGLDFADTFFEVGRRELGEAAEFVKGDFYQLSSQFASQAFDVSLSIQTLSWLPNYEEAMRQMMAVTRKTVFLTSLFSDFQVDCITQVHQYHENGEEYPDSPYFYNVYSFPRFRAFCLRAGAAEVSGRDFVIDIDLPRPRHGLMGTYTVPTQTGERLQFSGPLAMPWRMVGVRMRP